MFQLPALRWRPERRYGGAMIRSGYATPAFTALVWMCAGCSLATVDRVSSDRKPYELTCTRSNWAAGGDLALGVYSAFSAAEGAVAGFGQEPSREAAAAFVGATAVSLASAVYGFATTRSCRRLARRLGRSTDGAMDWLLVPKGIAYLSLLALEEHSQGERLPGTQAHPRQDGDPDRCGPLDVIVARCVDGYQSCATNPALTCREHGGVASRPE